MQRTIQEEIIAFLHSLQQEIIDAFEQFEPTKHFEKTNWDHSSGGGGTMAVLRGDAFEKAAVNWSGVRGENFPLPGEAKGPFFATGVSLITHMHNPHAPTSHMNIRYIETEKGHWFGGGYDLTPMGFPYEEDTDHFHNIAKQTLDQFDSTLYPTFSQNAKEYFTIPHRKRERGVGGIFFDHYNTGDFTFDLSLWKAIGKSFLPAIIPILKRRVNHAYTPEERESQLKARGSYVEFNLLYDRGTRFGFASGGNPDAILCSLPPLVRW